MSHYYVNDNNLKSDKHLVTYTYKGSVVKYNAETVVQLFWRTGQLIENKK